LQGKRIKQLHGQINHYQYGDIRKGYNMRGAYFTVEQVAEADRPKSYCRIRKDLLAEGLGVDMVDPDTDEPI
jgi:hypothetical protein